jgi:hypothetical protein
MAPYYQQGNLRAVFYIRIMLQHGLHGQPPSPDFARQAADYMALRIGDLRWLTARGEIPLRPLYHTALGYLALNGLYPGSPKDVKEAVIQTKYGTAEDFTPAINQYAHIGCTEDASLLFGLFSIDKSTCFSSSLKSAEAGDVLGMGNVSALYREGIGTGKDPLQAVSWAYKAATLNPPLARAQNDMGYYYETGSSVSKSEEQARKYYAAAAPRYPLAKTNLDRIGKKGGGAPSVTADIDY